MTNRKNWTLAVSSLVLGLTVTGCSMAGANSKVASAASTKVDVAAAARSANSAQQALERSRSAQAVAHAENAVAAAPGVAEYRTLLGRAYLAAGRFGSATSAFEDAVTLGNADTRTIIGLTLAQIAQGKNAEALALVERHQDSLPASDVGLAMALAGDSSRAAFVLTQAARRDGADSRTRQNLALTLALSGRWVEARILAAQDVPLNELDARLAEWAQLAQETAPAKRVASLIGTSPANDAGMPVRLALVPQADAAPQLASFDPAPLAEFAPPPPSADVAAPVLASVELPPSVAVPAPAAPAITPAKPSFDTPIIAAEPAPYRVAPRVAGEARVASAVTPPSAAAPARARSTAAASSSADTDTANTAPLPRTARFDAAKPAGWSVQIGAFDRLAVAQHKWSQLVRAHPVLANFHGSSHSATVRGATFHRLTVNGIASQADARQLCAQLSARGQSCFVRQMQGNENVRWAAAPTGVRLASR